MQMLSSLSARAWNSLNGILFPLILVFFARVMDFEICCLHTSFTTIRRRGEPSVFRLLSKDVLSYTCIKLGTTSLNGFAVVKTIRLKFPPKIDRLFDDRSTSSELVADSQSIRKRQKWKTSCGEIPGTIRTRELKIRPLEGGSIGRRGHKVLPPPPPPR